MMEKWELQQNQHKATTWLTKDNNAPLVASSPNQKLNTAHWWIHCTTAWVLLSYIYKDKSEQLMLFIGIALETLSKECSIQEYSGLHLSDLKISWVTQNSIVFYQDQ